MDSNEIKEQADGGGAIGTLSTDGAALNSILLGEVRDATTLEAGIATMRRGIADQLATTFGNTLDQHAKAPSPNDGGTPAKLEIDPEQIEEMNALYLSLTNDNETWFKALIANTPLAEAADQQQNQTQSQAAYA